MAWWAFRGNNGNILSQWQPYLEDVAFQYSVLRELFPAAKIEPYLCLADKAKTTGIHSLFSTFELSASTLSAARFRRPKVSYTGDADELRRSNFLTWIDVTAEVEELLPDVESSCAVFVASLENTVTKIPVPINVRCRTCEYRLLDDAMNLERTEKNGFAECWGDLAWIDPHILDLLPCQLDRWPKQPSRECVNRSEAGENVRRKRKRPGGIVD